MKKNLITLSMMMTLSACNLFGGDDDSETNTETENSQAVFSGTTSDSISNTAAAVQNTLSVTDEDEGEAMVVSQTDITTSYGTFSITESGAWTYEVNTSHETVAALSSASDTIIDTIEIESVDGTVQNIEIVIAGIDSEPVVVTPGVGDGGTVITPSLPSAVLTVPSVECSEVFTDVGDLENAATTEMTAGTTLCLADGTYTTGLELKFGGAGTETDPIKVAAENPGSVTFSGGEVSIKMGGTYTQLQGFIFEEPVIGSNFIETRFGTADLCHDCRITENVVINAKAENSGAILAHIYGKNVWLDHNILSGKTAENPMVSLNRWVSSDWTEEQKIAELAQGIVVYNNYIANRPPANGKMYANSGDNDYEAIRTGLSNTHHYPGNSIVAGNLFENIQGEAEVISNKGSNNVITGNTVRNSYGSITNRHGNTNVISNNFMFGDGYPYAGGLRIVDDGHTITNNYIEGARYKDTSHHGGIVILGHDGAGDGDNGYQQVENVHIAHNTVVNSVNSVNIDGGGKSTLPKKVYFANNIVDQAVGDVFVDTDRGLSSDSAFAGNIVYGSGALAETSDVDATDLGATFVSAMLEKGNDGLYRPSDSSPSLTAGTYDKGDFADVTIDLDGTSRGDNTEVGADDVNTDDVVSSPLTYENVGPLSYSYAKPDAIMVEADIANADFEQGATSWTGGTIIDTSADAFAGNSVLLSSSNTAEQSGIALTADSNYAISAFVKGTYSFVVNDHVFEGEITSSDYKYVVHEFTTGSTETSGVITLKVADEVTLNAGVVDGNMADFKSNNGALGVWDTYEDSDGGLGDLGSSSDSAFGSGSARARFKADEGDIHDFTSTPGLSQSIAGVATGVDLIYSLYFCDKKGDDSLTTLYYGLKDANGTVIADARAHVSNLDDAPEGTSKDCFKQVTLEVPNNTNADIEIFAVLEVDSSLTDAQLFAHEQYIDNDLEIRMDEFSLTYQGTPDVSAEAKFDEVRLVKRTIDELAD